MNTEIFGIIAMFVITIALAIPLGKYIAKVYEGEKTWAHVFSIHWIKYFLNSVVSILKKK